MNRSKQTTYRRAQWGFLGLAALLLLLMAHARPASGDAPPQPAPPATAVEDLVAVPAGGDLIRYTKYSEEERPTLPHRAR